MEEENKYFKMERLNAFLREYEELNRDEANYVIVDRLQINNLVEEVRGLKEMIAHDFGLLKLTEKVALLARGGMLKVNDVAKLTGRSMTTVRRWLNRGDILMVKDGRDYCIDGEDFIEWYRDCFKAGV